MSGTAIQIQARDNVATLLADTEAGPIRILNAAGGAKDICVTEPIRHGHKVALCDLSTGDAVFKYGVRIGHATREVPTGSWVHLHNLASDLDERSGTLDAQTGVPTDTMYQ